MENKQDKHSEKMRRQKMRRNAKLQSKYQKCSRKDSRRQAKSASERSSRAQESTERKTQRKETECARHKKRHQNETEQDKAVRLQHESASKRARRQASEPSRSRLSFNTLWRDFPTEPDFSKYEFDPELATLLYHANTNSTRFRRLGDLNSQDEQQHESAKADIIKDIRREAVTDQDRRRIMEDYNKAMGRPSMIPLANESGVFFGIKCADIQSCACCGVRDMCRDGCVYHTVSIDKLGVLELEDEVREQYLKLKQNPLFLPCDDEGNFRYFHPHLGLNVFESARTKLLYALHPEYVSKANNDEMVTLCSDCHSCLIKSGEGISEVPKYAVKHVNFGSTRRIGLADLTFLEVLVDEWGKMKRRLVVGWWTLSGTAVVVY
jgi:hypothetical protein